MIKSKKQMFVVIGAFVLVMLLGTITYAFFNYTRTGTANTISTGQINFLTTQSNTLSLTNVFPIASSEVSNANLDEVEIRIQGDTTYSGGEEFEITIEGVNNTIGTSPNEKTIPINFVARYVPTATGDNIGSAAVSDYYEERGSTTTVYSLTETGVAENGKQILVGYIPANGEIDGTLKVSAYLDASNIAISDTYYENVTTTPTPSAPNDQYGTTTEWVNGRTVLTTAEWNALQNSQEPLSFKLKAVSQEGTWIEPLAVDIISSLSEVEETPYGKVFTNSNPANYVVFNNESWRIIGVYDDENGSMLKIIKSVSIGKYQYSSSSTNIWENSSLSNYLNQQTSGGYYYSLSQDAKNMIHDGVWYPRAVNYNYNAIQSTPVVGTTTSVTQKVGIIEYYDALHASPKECWSVSGNSTGSQCFKEENWIMTKEMWVMNPNNYSSNFGTIILARSGISYANLTGSLDVYPVVYLNHEVTISGGDGASPSTAYILGYSAS